MTRKAAAVPALRPPSSATTVAEAMLTVPKRCDPTTTVGDLHRFFADDHVHAALIVDGDALLAVVERDDLEGQPDPDAPARGVGSLGDRVVGGSADLARTHDFMLASGRRRLAVVDAHGRCVGLLCLKRARDGFCTDRDVSARRPSTMRFGQRARGDRARLLGRHAEHPQEVRGDLVGGTVDLRARPPSRTCSTPRSEPPASLRS